MFDFVGEILGEILGGILFEAVRWSILLPYRLLRWSYQRLCGRSGRDAAMVQAAPTADEADRSRPVMD